MAQKQKLRPSPMDEPPTASSSSSSSSSSSEEQVSSEEEEVSSEENDEKEENLPPAPTNSHPQPSSSDSETQSESDTTPAKVKSIASKPKAQAQKPKAQPSPAPSNSGSKRPAETNTHSANNVTDPKRVKKKSSDNSSPSTVVADDEKKTLRRWSEEDELLILKGVIDFISKKKQDPLKITNAFHDFITKSLDWQVSRNQLKSKLQGLKRKFDTNSAKVENGEGPSFSKPHDQKVFELSKKAWGTDQGGGPNGPVEKPKSNGSASKKKETVGGSSRNAAAASAKKSKPEIERESELELNQSEKMDIDHKVDSGSVGLLLRELSRYKEAVQLDEDEVKRGLQLIGESKRAVLAGKWKELRYAEMKLLAKRSRLIAEQTKLIVDVRQSLSGDYDSQ